MHLFGIFTDAKVKHMSVDVMSDKRRTPCKWRGYFCVSASSVMRLRRVYAQYRKSCYVSTTWSPLRWQAYREWRAALFGRVDGGELWLPSTFYKQIFTEREKCVSQTKSQGSVGTRTTKTARGKG
jgi:hypothetical protein